MRGSSKKRSRSRSSERRPSKRKLEERIISVENKLLNLTNLLQQIVNGKSKEIPESTATDILQNGTKSSNDNTLANAPDHDNKSDEVQNNQTDPPGDSGENMADHDLENSTAAHRRTRILVLTTTYWKPWGKTQKSQSSFKAIHMTR
ncbi:uncharacterized protein LOC122502287 [Leptopilina heterotoma]|uniref:uncharacterized protein LOC122502287 n=1 Tax=Leptopilina heterotoma TaxID=63436 RepID=UPI001CA912B3|nr:uncharacterized protein LOC122502287 [Leptopilina heterotoma]